MSKSDYILAIDQGTTSSRAIVFDKKANIICSYAKEFKQIFPKDGWVEHDANEIVESCIFVTQQAIENQPDITCIGITNQRETTILWDRKTGKPIYNAIVWQDRRTADLCEELRKQGHETIINTKTGLLLDPYFSATKIKWILDNVTGARARAKNGEICFGTVDSFLLWHLTKGAQHKTDATNASRTMLYNIENNCWDEELLGIFGIPKEILPKVCDSASEYGITDPNIFGKQIPIYSMIGDQQAATVGQACFKEGMAKSTYGTGCFIMLNTGDKIKLSKHRLLTTIAYRLNGKTTYALEGSVFIAGAAVSWLKKIDFIDNARQTEFISESLKSNGGVYVIPAFTGLGAPHWNPHARGAIFGLNRDTSRNEIIRATLESICYQTYDLLDTMKKDGATISNLKTDGGMAANNWLMQFLADITFITIERPKIIETTALGAAYLAGLQAGIYKSLDDISQNWQKDQSFLPMMDSKDRNVLLQNWTKYVKLLTAN